MDPLSPLTSARDALALAALALLVFLAASNLLIAWRIARQTKVQQRLARAQMELMRAAATFRAHEEDPHATLRCVVSAAAGEPVGELTPLRGSAAPAYLLLREDDTRRRLLLAANGCLKAALQAEGIGRSLLPWRRRPTHLLSPLNGNPLVLEEITTAWAALAPRLGLPGVAPPAERWELALLPPEELNEP